MSASTSPDPVSAAHVLDLPVRSSLLGAHAHLAESLGAVWRYIPDVSPFMALPPEPTGQDWRDAAKLAGPGGMVGHAGDLPTPPRGWRQVMHIDGVQMVDAGIDAAPDAEAVRLGPGDVPEMLELVEHAQPGPFRRRTIEMGAYLGLRHEGRLIAMAGERLHPPGWTEISAVCTHADFRGRGLATRLVLAVAHGVRERGESVFLHASASNTTAIRLYETLGFRVRRTLVFSGFEPPAE